MLALAGLKDDVMQPLQIVSSTIADAIAAVISADAKLAFQT